MLLDRLRAPGFRIFDFRGPPLPFLSPLPGAAGALLARPWSARCYGVARQREGSRPNGIGGLRRAFSPAFRAGSLYPLARGCRRSWRGEGCNYGLWLRRRRKLCHDPIATARCCSTGSGRLDLDLMISGPRVYLIYHPYAGARALMARPWSARCYGAARQREGSRQNSIGGSGVLSLRHFGLVLIIPWRVGAEAAGAAKDTIMVYGFGGAVSFATTRSQRRDAARPARAA